MTSKAKQDLIFAYLDTPKPEREPLKDFLKQTGIHKLTFRATEKLHAVVKDKKVRELKIQTDRDLARKKEQYDNAWATMGGYDSETWLKTRTPDADKALLRAVQGGSPGAIKIFYQLIGQLVEKQEHKVEVGLTADEIARRNLEADRQLREGGYRVAEV